MLQGIVVRKAKKLARDFLQDELFISRRFQDSFNRPIDFFNPETFNEKLQIQKLYNRDPKMTKLADKYLVREFVDKKGYSSILNSLLGVYNSPEDINFCDLPEQFVIKCNHSYATNIICENKNSINEHQAKEKLNEWLQKNHYYRLREWAYKDIPPRIIIESYLGNELKDYKFFCYSGEPRYVQVDSERFDSHTRSIYDVNWVRLQCQTNKIENNAQPEAQPPFFKAMIEIAKDLSSEFNFCRVDFLATPDSFYFGEITFYPAGGFGPFDPEHYDYIFGEPFDISKIKIPLMSRLKIKTIHLLDKR